jgi:hypothetical protein
MEKNKTGFLRGFTWKRFIGWSLFFLVINLLVDLIADGIAGITTMAPLKWAGKIVAAIIIGFFMATDVMGTALKSKHK